MSDKLSERMLADILHPEYGPCDGFRNGECSVCHDAVKNGIAANASLQAKCDALLAEVERYRGAVALLRVGWLAMGHGEKFVVIDGRKVGRLLGELRELPGQKGLDAVTGEKR